LTCSSASCRCCCGSRSCGRNFAIGTALPHLEAPVIVPQIAPVPQGLGVGLLDTSDIDSVKALELALNASGVQCRREPPVPCEENRFMPAPIETVDVSGPARPVDIAGPGFLEARTR